MSIAKNHARITQQFNQYGYDVQVFLLTGKAVITHRESGRSHQFKSLAAAVREFFTGAAPIIKH
jgi:hypothetical protein